MLITLCIIYEYLVPEVTCSNEVPNCEDTGGKCVFDQSQTVRCSCPTETVYVKNVGCRGML